nr:host-nuclease inhibitor Gam family protein [uncultured Tyzzerella sp.]
MENLSKNQMGLEEFLENEQTEENTEKKEKESQSFKVTDLLSANWCFKKLKVLENKKKQIEEYAELEIKRIEDYLQKEQKQINEDAEYFKFLLQQFVEEQQEVDPKFKLSTVDGTASFGKPQQKIKYEDNVMLEFCKNNNLDEFVNVVTVEKLKKKEFNNYLNVVEGNVVTMDGEVLEQAYVEEFKNFNVKLK